jgi:hypothetical protein
MFSSILLAVAAAYLAFAGYTFLYQDHLVYFPERGLIAHPRERGMEYEDVRLTTADGETLHGWFVPARDARATVLYFHGNAGNISHRLDRIARFHQMGLTVFIIDYRGYGQSSGRPSEAGTYEDATAAWRYLTQTRGLPPERVIVFGRSLGAAVGAWLATQTTPRALILESAFTSAPDLGAEVYPWLPVRLLSRIQYPVRDYLKGIHCPVLIVHSRADEIIPFHHGQQLFAAAHPPKEFLEIEGGHNEGFLVSGPGYVNGLEAFIRRYVAGPV